MQSRMNAVLIITSTAGTRPLPSASGHEALGDDGLEHAGQLQPDLLLLMRRKHGDDAVDRFRRVERVQRREDEMSGFGGEQSRLDRLEVAHFADEDDVGILPQRAAQGLRERLRVDGDLALVDDRLVVAVQELDRVLDRHHVRAARPVDVVDHRRQRRALAAAGRSGHEHEAALFAGDLLEHGGQRQVVDGLDLPSG